MGLASDEFLDYLYRNKGKLAIYGTLYKLARIIKLQSYQSFLIFLNMWMI